MLPLHMFAKNTWFHTKSSLWDESKMAAMVHNEEKIADINISPKLFK